MKNIEKLLRKPIMVNKDQIPHLITAPAHNADEKEYNRKRLNGNKLWSTQANDSQTNKSRRLPSKNEKALFNCTYEHIHTCTQTHIPTKARS